MPDSDQYTIDVGAIFRKKFGEKTPRWLVRLGRKLLHEDFLNDFFKDHCNTYQVTGSGKRPRSGC